MLHQVLLSIVAVLVFTVTPGASWNDTDSDDCDCSLPCQNTTAYNQCIYGIYTCVQDDPAYYDDMPEDDENDILWPCINEIVNNDTYECSCYLDVLQCYVDDCGDNNDNCSQTCYSDHFINCLVDENGCWDGFTALSNKWFDDDSNETVATPKIVNTWVNDTYCSNDDTKDNCDAEFWNIWNCYRECIWGM